MTGATNNPFAVRSPPGRSNNDGTDTQSHTGASIIAPSKFGASAASHSVNESQSIHYIVCLSLKEDSFFVLISIRSERVQWIGNSVERIFAAVRHGIKNTILILE